jgi:hypothetical protein
MPSTKNKNKTPQLTRRAALTTPPGVFCPMEIPQVDSGQCRQYREGW